MLWLSCMERTSPGTAGSDLDEDRGASSRAVGCNHASSLPRLALPLPWIHFPCHLPSFLNAVDMSVVTITCPWIAGFVLK